MSEVKLFAITVKMLVETDPFHMLLPFSGVDFSSQTPAVSSGLARTALPQKVEPSGLSEYFTDFLENVCNTNLRRSLFWTFFT